MKFVGFKEVAVKSIVVDAVDIKRRSSMQHVIDLAEDAEQNGGDYMHPPVVRADDRRLIAGRDRVAGAIAKKRKRIWVHFAECTDDEAKGLELSENIYRRPLDKDQRAQAISALVKLREQQERALDEAKRAAGEAVSEAPQNSPIARARKEVARTAGVSMETVKSHEKRASKSAKKAEKPSSEPGALHRAPAASNEVEKDEAPAVELPAGFQSYGLDVPATEREAIAETLTWLKGHELAARQTVAGMTDAEKHRQFAIAPAHIQAIRERAQALGHALREAMPAALCPYCKDRPELKDACNGCGGVGVVGRHAGDHVPRELLATEPVMVAVDGQIVPLAGWKPAKAKPQKNGKPIHVEVVDEDGGARELTLDRSAAEESEELF